MGRRFLLPLIPVVCYSWHLHRVWDEYHKRKPPTTLSRYIMLRSLPLRSMSTLSGVLSELEIPSLLRRPIYGLYAWLYSCKLAECAELKSFPNFQSFFTRRLKEGARSTASDCVLSCPCDGKLVQQGCVEFSLDGEHPFEAIKGVFYKVPDLIGLPAYTMMSVNSNRSSWRSLLGLRNPKKYLHYATIYLAPGDYHRFHAPTDMRITMADNITGEKALVAPCLTKVFPDVLQVNQRAIILGNDSLDGTVCVIPVGSLNVGCLDVTATPGSSISRGSDIGCFKMGSTIVLLYLSESKDLCWLQPSSSRVSTGQALLSCNK
jgi:phosphatidylserine decarboxylase